MKRLALLFTISLPAFAAGPPAPYYPSPHMVWAGDDGGFQTTFQPTMLAAMLFSASGNGNDWAPVTGTGGAALQPNTYAGLLVCSANCSNGLSQTWVPYTGAGGGGGATIAPNLPVVASDGSGNGVAATSSGIAVVLNTSPSTTLAPSLLPAATASTQGATIVPASAPGLYTSSASVLTSTASAAFPGTPIIGQRINITAFPTVPIQTNTSSFSPALYEQTPQSIWMPSHANDPYHGGMLSIGTPAGPEPGNFTMTFIGDSIPNGFGLTAGTQAYSQILAAWNGLKIVQSSANGATCYGQQNAHLNTPTNSQGVTSSDLGINDLARYGIAALPDYRACKDTEWVNAGLGETAASSMTQSGTAWTAATVGSHTGTAFQTTTINNPLNGTFNGDALWVSVAYGPSANTTQYTITIDGTVYKTATAAIVANAYPATNGDTGSLVETFGFYNLPAVTGALHTWSINETVNGTYPLTLWGYTSNDHAVRSAFLNINPARMTNPGTLGTGPGCTVATGGIGYSCWCNATMSGGTVTQTATQCDAAVTAFKQSNNTSAALMAKAGIDVVTMDIDPYYFNAQDVTQTIGDGLHPGVAPHLKIAGGINKYITTAFRMRDRENLAALSAQFNPTGPTPTMVAGAAAGTSPTCTSLVGTNTSFVISCTTGTSTTTGTLATVTFNPALGSAPQGCQLTSRSAATAPTATSVYTTAPSTTTWTIGVASALTASTAYSWSGICL